MNYRNIIKSRDLRVKLLTFLNWIPDSIMLRLQYWLQTGRKLNLKNPKRFTEKLQLYKMKYRNPEMLRCTDKYEVRKYIEEKGFGKYLIPLIGVYNSVEEIDYSKLPNKFVAKTTDGGGGNQVFICKDKHTLSEEVFKERLRGWMSARKVKKQAGREWAYENNYPRRIIIEELIGADNIKKDLCDYKFFCFNGEPHFCQLIQDRSTEETIDFYDMEWNHMPFRGLNPQCGSALHKADKPEDFEQMKDIAQKLSKGFPFVRVDLYSVKDGVYFGELTFYPASGYGHFTPDEWDEKIGEILTIPNHQLLGGGKYLIINSVISGFDGLNDYKFFCFDGKVSYIYGLSDRNMGQSVRLGVYDREFKKLNVSRNDERTQDIPLPKPLNFDKMISIAESLSKDFPHVRVDLYNIAGDIYFGELTFYDGSGYMTFTPDSFDEEMGQYFDISSFA